MPVDIQITTEMLYKGALIFALMDAVYIPFLIWRVGEESFRKLKWYLAITAGLVWFGIWNWAIGNFWDSIYSYVFPAWAQRWTPWIALMVAILTVLCLWSLAMRWRWNVILTYGFAGGLLGSMTHTWAVFRGIVTKPPMLQGASPLATVVIAFFEYLFYWCTILLIAWIMEWIYTVFGNQYMAYFRLRREEKHKRAPS